MCVKLIQRQTIIKLLQISNKSKLDVFYRTQHIKVRSAAESSCTYVMNQTCLIRLLKITFAERNRPKIAARLLSLDAACL